MNVRRSATVLAATGVLAVALAPAALAAPSPAPAIPSGLYGTTDPTYDGVWRQSLAFLAQDAAGVQPAAAAVNWLTGQQCADGSFASFRPDPAQDCDAKTMADSNATAAAVQALASLGGHDAVVAKSVDWLKSVQNEDGGWSYNPGGASDANSTGIVVGALAAAGEKVDQVASKKGARATNALASLQVSCAEKDIATAADLGAFAYQPDQAGKLSANADATAAAVLGMLGMSLLVEAPKSNTPLTEATPTCRTGAEAAQKVEPAQAAAAASAYLARTTAKTGDHLMSAMPGATDQPDVGNTADTVIALAAAGHRDAAAKPLAWLEQNGAAWAKTAGPAGYAQLVLAAHAGGADPKAFGGTDLVAQLNAQGPAPAAAASKEQSSANADTKDDAAEKSEEKNSGSNIWWIIGVGAVAGIGIGILISGRKKNGTS
ncbi:prenyltransferase/squalene oxidase repeat-containing protein [Streptomyces sp. NPDC006879]|uniref:prenyltransferase/squalene oxidase repeat-containing protein n=1 Tax=Streptomyces sp. NPDC006879 TaxID=3364767 RepID=UPI0036878D75